MKSLSSPDHPLIKELAKLVSDKKFRKERSKVVVEGVKMVHQLKEEAELIVATDATLFPACSAEKILITAALLRKITALESPEGVLALLALPKKRPKADSRRLLALDGIADPGNVGTLFRTAFALGWEGILLLEGSADPFNDKALRAAKGATFKLPFEEMTKELFLQQIKGYRLLGADLKGKEPSPLSKEERVVLLLGSEGKGLSPELREKAEALSLPMREGAESLNVAIAGGILLYMLGGR